MMVNMTREGKYLKGLELEQEGLSAQQIADRLGYETVQAWYSTKHYYSKRNAAWAAKAETVQEAQEVPIVAAAQAAAPAVKADIKQAKPAHEHAAVPMTITTETRAVGRDLRYRIKDGRLSIARKNQKDKPLNMTLEEFQQMVHEVASLKQV